MQAALGNFVSLTPRHEQAVQSKIRRGEIISRYVRHFENQIRARYSRVRRNLSRDLEANQAVVLCEILCDTRIDKHHTTQIVGRLGFDQRRVGDWLEGYRGCATPAHRIQEEKSKQATGDSSVKLGKYLVLESSFVLVLESRLEEI